MNFDDFEKHLQRQPMRHPPTEWRGEILDAAKARTKTAAAPRESLLGVIWRQWMARVSPAWGALAAVWLAIVGVNSFLLGAGEPQSRMSSAPPSSMMALQNLHRMQEKLLADQWEEATATLPAPRMTTPLSPRSDARREREFNEANLEPQMRSIG